MLKFEHGFDLDGAGEEGVQIRDIHLPDREEALQAVANSLNASATTPAQPKDDIEWWENNLTSRSQSRRREREQTGLKTEIKPREGADGLSVWRYDKDLTHLDRVRELKQEGVLGHAVSMKLHTRHAVEQGDMAWVSNAAVMWKPAEQLNRILETSDQVMAAHTASCGGKTMELSCCGLTKATMATVRELCGKFSTGAKPPVLDDEPLEVAQSSWTNEKSKGGWREEFTKALKMSAEAKVMMVDEAEKRAAAKHTRDQNDFDWKQEAQHERFEEKLDVLMDVQEPFVRRLCGTEKSSAFNLEDDPYTATDFDFDFDLHAYVRLLNEEGIYDHPWVTVKLNLTSQDSKASRLRFIFSEDASKEDMGKTAKLRGLGFRVDHLTVRSASPDQFAIDPDDWRVDMVTDVVEVVLNAGSVPSPLLKTGSPPIRALLCGLPQPLYEGDESQTPFAVQFIDKVRTAQSEGMLQTKCASSDMSSRDQVLARQAQESAEACQFEWTCYGRERTASTPSDPDGVGNGDGAASDGVLATKAVKFFDSGSQAKSAYAAGWQRGTSKNDKNDEDEKQKKSNAASAGNLRSQASIDATTRNDFLNSKWRETVDEMDEYVDFQLRRYGFMFWDPFSMFMRITLKEHPMFKVFILDLKMLSLERTLVFSCSIIGSLVIAALFFDAGAGSVGAPGNVTVEVNESAEEIPWWLTTGTTTTTTPLPPSNIVAEMMTTVVVSGISIVFGTLPAVALVVLFSKSIHREEVSEAKAKKIINGCRIKRLIGFTIAAVYIPFCFFFLWMFAMSRPMDIQAGFTISSVLNLAFKIVTKPFLVVCIFTVLMMFVQGSSHSELVLHLIPLSVFNFSMFTAVDADDMFVQEITILGLEAGGAGEDIFEDLAML